MVLATATQIMKRRHFLAVTAGVVGSAVAEARLQRSGGAAAISAGVLAVLVVGVPFKLGLVLAALVGIAVGMFVEAQRP